MSKTIAWAEGTFANVTEPFTVMLANEAQQFATDSNRKVTSAQSYYTDIIVIRGSQERTDYTIGNITSGSGITVSKSSKRVTFSVSAGTTIGADAGVIEIPITLDGQTVKKQFSWSCGKQGPQGVKGQDGNSFAWNMLSETNCGKKHWRTASSGGKYSVESETTEDNIEAVKLICTESVSSSEWSHTCFTDLEMLKQLKPSTKYTLSYDIKANRSGMISHTICRGNITNSCTNTVVVSNIIGDETWQHISVVLTTNDLKTTPTNEVVYLGRTALSKVGYSIIKNLKLAEGDIDTPWSPSQSDIEGKGVAEIVQYYLATSQASGVTSSTSGWSTDITTQKLTADKKYLWNCYQTKYSDGTSEPISTPKVIGVYGDKGQKGEDGQDGAGFHWNLLKYSGDLSQMSYGKVGGYIGTQEFVSDASTPSKNALKSTITTVGQGMYIQGKYLKKEAIKRGNIYTVSVWCKCSSAKDIGVMNVEFLDKKVNISMPKLSTEWQQYIITGVANKDVTTTSSGSAISFYYGNKMAVGDIFYISSPKVEEGDKPSPWCTTYEETLAKNLSITPSSQYFKSTDGGKTFAPNTITIKPTIQGEINFGKWQYSIDGGVSFADVVSGQTGLTISNNVLAVSKDSSLYSDTVTMVTFRAVASDSSFYDTCSIAKIYDVSDIGDGRNLIQKSQLNPIDGAELSLDDYTKNGTVIFTNKSENSGFSFDSYNNYQPNSKYVLSYYFTKTSGTMNSFGGFHNGKGVTYTYYSVDDKVYSGGSYAGQSHQIGVILNDGKRHRIVVCYTTPTTIPTDTSVNYTYIQPGRGNTNTAFGVKIEELKLEKGSSPTGWSPAPEDVQTAILSTKSEISDVSLKVDNNKQAIEQRVEKTTYQQDLKLVKGDISKANEGLNKWRYEIYPKSLFASEYQGKSTMDVFAKNTNLTPSQSVLINDTDLSIVWNYAENYIGYALTFTKFSAAKSVAITFAHDDGAHIYLNGKLIGGSDAYSQTGESLTLGFVKGWNCIEVVVNEGASTEGFKLGTTISALSECQLMNCYYGTPVARQSHITNQLVQNTTDIKGISTKVSKVTSVIGDNGENFTSFKKDYSDFKQTMNGFKTIVGQTYVTKDDFNGLEIGGRNLLLNSAFKNDRKSWTDWGAPATRELVTSNNKVWAHIVGNKQNYQGFNQWTESGSIKTGDNITFSARIKGGAGNQIFTIGIHWMNSSNTIIDQTWHTFTVGTTDGVYTWTTTASGANCSKLNLMVGVSDTSTAYNVYFTELKLEKGNKATDWTPAPEDNEINGQNLVSNLPSNWEQGSFNDGKTNVGCDYDTNKSSMTTRICVKELVPVSGTITISNAYSNQSKKPIQHCITAFDVNKKWLGSSYVSTAWSDFPRTVDMKDAKYIAVIVKYKDESAITPSDISQICLKIERGTSATPFTLAPEDVNGKIVNVETIANQTANKFSWIVKSGTSSSNFEITDRLMNLVSANINLDGIVSFMNTAKGDGRKNLYNLDYSSFENVASQENAICYAKDNGVTSVGIDSSVSYDGNKSLKISYTTANLNSSTTPLYLGSSANNYGCVKIQAGKQYILSCYVKSDSTTGMFMIDIQGHDTPDTKTDGLYLSNIDPRKLPGSSTGVNLSTDWQRAVCAIKVADNATGLYWSVVPLIWGKPSSSSAPKTFNVWVDCIMLEEVDSISNQPGTYILDKETIIDGGSIKTDTITGNQILAGSITADKIDVNSIFAKDITATGTITGANLIGATGTFSGQITATKGSIAGWTIIKDKMYTTGSGKYTGIGKYGSAYAFWAGATSNDNGNSAVFKVGHTGKLTATDADITGTITATEGKIGRYDITSTYMMTNSGSNASGIGGNQAFWAGAEDSNSAPFRVGYDGSFVAENATIYGNIKTGNIGDAGDTAWLIDGHLSVQGTANDTNIYSTWFEFGIGGDYYLKSVSDGVECYRNLYATDLKASGWLYASEVHSSGAVVIASDSESFYWAHGYQIARGTSWGGVCVGDDGQQLRLYGTSIWASHSISTSDENLKENFTTLDQYEEFYMNLNPIGFNYIGDYDGKKTHFGFGAHKTEDILESEGYDADKFAVVTHRPLVQEDIEKRFGKDVKADIETEYGVSYTEFIALNTHMIQKTRRELTKVKQEKADLEARLQAIEAKLGL